MSYRRNVKYFVELLQTPSAYVAAFTLCVMACTQMWLLLFFVCPMV